MNKNDQFVMCWIGRWEQMSDDENVCTRVWEKGGLNEKRD